MPVNTSPKRRPSRTANRRSKILPSLPSKPRPGLALDTSVSRHKAPAPQQVFPESKTQELSFISLADIKALKKQRSVNKQKQKQLERAQLPATQRSYSSDVVQQDLPPPYTRSKTSDDSQALHKRVKGLRPSPLDLSTDISPSDRAITIGISVDPKTASHHSRTPSSPAAGQKYPANQPQRRPSEKHNGQEAVTPTIVITPAKEDFDFDLDAQTSPDSTHEAKNHRATSSIYSRYTNCMPANGHTPPVPPLPLFAVGKSGRVQESDATSVAEEALKVPKRGREKNLSVCTVFEEDQPPTNTTQSAKRLTSQSHLPTPRRSKGWWNLITSPFSAGSKSNAFFWKSSPQEEDEDRARMLDDTSDMPSDAHAGVIFSNRSLEDLDLRSAPPTDSRRNSFSKGKPRQPQRSDTAPGALDPSGTDGVNIYTVPWVGAAADYYNPHKNFPSIMLPPEGLGDRGLEGWSPSQSVYREPRGSVKGVVAHVDDDDDDSDSTFIDDNPFEEDSKEGARGLDDEKSPFSDAHASNAFVDFSGTHPAANADKKFFSTPETAELRGASPEQPSRPPGPTRNETVESHFSPLTATPVIEDARLGTLINPSVVDVRTPARTDTTPPPPPPPPANAGLGAVTMSSRGLDDDRSTMDEKAPFRPTYTHQRNSSHGLGIDTRSTTTDPDAGSEKSLFPPPKPLAQQPRLGTDKFGQLRIEEHSDREEDWAPWWRRFMWPLADLVGGVAVLLLVVLLAVFVVQGHEDMGVQVEWVALAGFPALPTGVATVVGAGRVGQEGGCVKPEGLWSCGVPVATKEGSPASGDGESEGATPNFRFEIRFRNKTRDDFDKTDLLPATSSTASHKRSISRPSLAHAKFHKRSAWTDSLYAPLPAPPSEEEMISLGNTTDGVSEPFEGEATPFYLTLLNATALEEEASGGEKKMRVRKRERGDGVYPYPTESGGSSDDDDDAGDKDSGPSPSPSDSSSNNTSHSSHDGPSQIPLPHLTTTGHPAPPQLYPLAHAQPLRLFNRGQKDEHYGFSTFYDRSLYVRTSGSNGTLGSGTDVVANTPLEESNAICTFSQTRMRVQIWTRAGTIPGTAALPSGNGTGAASPSSPDTDPALAASNSTANAMSTPGSFPYPITLTLDRHGGDAGKKGVYCYGLDSEGRVLGEAKGWVVEDRRFGGEIINAAAVPGDGRQRGKRSEGEGEGIDGGDGGCSCSWGSGGGKL